MFRKGIVVEVHPEDHSVDLVMADDGSRLVGVQVLSWNGSTRTGTVDLPEIPARADKWDITQPTGQDMHAAVGYMGRHPFVAGFFYPQISQMTFKDPKLRVKRHQSDVYSFIDGVGNMEVVHPSGAYFRMGATPDHAPLDGKNADGNFKIDRNTGPVPHVVIEVPGAFKFHMTPEGAISFVMSQGGLVQCGAPITVQAPHVTLDTPTTSCTGNLEVAGNATITGHTAISGGLSVSGGNGAAVSGNLTAEGGAFTHNGANVGSVHVHKAQGSNADTSGPH